MAKAAIRKLYRALYEGMPGKGCVFALWRKLAPPGHKLARHLRYRGWARIHIDKAHSFYMWNDYAHYLESDKFWYGLLAGQHESCSLRVWLALGAQAKCMLDIGANTGIFALSAATRYTSVQVHAFEPAPASYALLQANIRKNRLTERVHAHSLALSNESGSATFYLPEKQSYTASLEADKNNSGKSIVVELQTLDALIAAQSVPLPDVIKMDVEGHEPQVLEGMTQTLAQHKPAIIAEIHTQDVADRLMEQLAPYGYRYFTSDERSKIWEATTLSDNNHHNYFLVPPAYASLLENMVEKN